MSAKKPNPVKQKAFLAAYSKRGNISDAARAAKCHRSQHYEWINDPDYADAFFQAQEQAVELLELEARKRATRGSDLLLIFLLKSLRPHIYRDNFKGEINVNTPMRVDLSNLTNEQLHTLRTLAAAAAKTEGNRRGTAEVGQE